MNRDELIAFIREQAQLAGENPDMAVRVAQLESSLNPNSKNKRSSASGLFQLTDNRKRELGIDPKKKMTVEQQVAAGLQSLKDNREYLQRRLGREPQPHEVYAAHFSGNAGSAKMLAAPEDSPVEQLLSRKAMRSNPTLRGYTAGEIRGMWKDKFGDLPVAQPAAPAEPSGPLDVGPDWDMLGRSQVTAQAPVEAPVMMAQGGEVDDPRAARLARMIEGASTDEHFRKINELLGQMQSGSPAVAQGPRAAELLRGFAEGGSAGSYETPKEDLEMLEASRPSFRMPSSGKGRQAGPISQALDTGEGQVAFLKGMTNLPQNVMGAPVDISNLLLSAVGMGSKEPVGGSEWLKRKTQEAGMGFTPPQDSTLRGFYGAGDIASGLVNPAAATRGAVSAAARTGEAAKMMADLARQDPAVAAAVERMVGKVVPAAQPAYAVRPAGGGISAVRAGALPEYADDALGDMEKWLISGVNGATGYTPITPEHAKAVENFWQTKAANYITRQFGTPNDPVLKQIIEGKITTPELEKDFRKYAIEQAKVGKTRVNPQTGEEVFYPKFPEALEDLTRKYDTMTGLKAAVYAEDPALFDRSWTSGTGKRMEQAKAAAIEDQMIAAGVRPDLINKPSIELGMPAEADVTSFYQKALINAPEFASNIYKKLEVPGPITRGEKEFDDTMFRRAFATGEPVYDMSLSGPLRQILKPTDINEYLRTLSPKEIDKIRFEDVVKNSAKMHLDKFETEKLIADIQAGRRVNERVFSEGVSAPLLQFEEGPHAGYAWKRLEKRKATVPEGAYMGHSVGGYEIGGPGYTSGKREGFNSGEWQVYSLRDNRNRPVNTVEVQIDPKSGQKVVTQIKGNGARTGNVAPQTYSNEVLDFLTNVLKPQRIYESDSYLTPALQQYKMQLENKTPF